MKYGNILLWKYKSQKPIYVVDASVVLKWFCQPNERDVDRAYLLREQVREGKIDIQAPELLIYEITNVLRYKQDLKVDDLDKAIESIFEMRMLGSVSKSTMKKAVQIARKYDATIYDATYLAFAEDLRCPLITADSKFYRKVSERVDIIFLEDFENMLPK